MSSVVGKVILIIGGTGSLGNELVKHLKTGNKIIIFSRDENKQWLMRNRHPDLIYVIGDIRNRESIEKCILEYRPNILIIASALKHIDICEVNIEESVRTNLLGSQNVINIVTKLNDENIETVLMISTIRLVPLSMFMECVRQ